MLKNKKLRQKHSVRFVEGKKQRDERGVKKEKKNFSVALSRLIDFFCFVCCFALVRVNGDGGVAPCACVTLLVYQNKG